MIIYSVQTNMVQDNVEHGQQTATIVMAFSEAFDKVDDHKLILKLHRLGVNGLRSGNFLG